MNLSRILGVIDKQLYFKRIRALNRLTLPHFLGIGFPKAGTTWLYENLRKHPDVYMSDPKELNYFTRGYAQPLSTYAEKFRPGVGKVCGEISPGYAYLPCQRLSEVRRIVPRARLILMLRNPIEQQWSHAVHDLAYGQNRSIDSIPPEAWRARFEGSAIYQSGGMCRIIDRWTSAFGPEQLLIGFYEDVSQQPKELLTRVFQHIGVSSDVDWSTLPYAKVIVPPAKPEHQGQDTGRGVVASGHVNSSMLIPQYCRERLMEMYEADLKELQRRFGERVSSWLDF